MPVLPSFLTSKDSLVIFFMMKKVVSKILIFTLCVYQLSAVPVIDSNELSSNEISSYETEFIVDIPSFAIIRFEDDAINPDDVKLIYKDDESEIGDRKIVKRDVTAARDKRALVFR